MCVPATTHNAIALLEIKGAPASLVSRAVHLAAILDRRRARSRLRFCEATLPFYGSNGMANEMACWEGRTPSQEVPMVPTIELDHEDGGRWIAEVVDLAPFVLH